MSEARIGLRYCAEYRPEGRLTNPEIVERFGFEELFLSKKLGIEARPLATAEEFTSDLAVAAVERLCAASGLALADIDCIAVVTQTPDRLLPNVAAVVHGRLGLPHRVAAFDINLGCSGFVYGLSVLAGFMETTGAANGVLVTAETYSKIMDPNDRNVIPLFGDAATATWLSSDGTVYTIGKPSFGTDGGQCDVVQQQGDITKPGHLFMNGREIFNFMMREVPGTVAECLAKNGLSESQIDLWVFHQASRFMLETLAKRLALDLSRVPIDIADSGNTVSSTIPFVLSRRLFAGTTPAADFPEQILICGFGVGLSWGTNVLTRVDKT